MKSIEKNTHNFSGGQLSLARTCKVLKLTFSCMIQDREKLIPLNYF